MKKATTNHAVQKKASRETVKKEGNNERLVENGLIRAVPDGRRNVREERAEPHPFEAKRSSRRFQFVMSDAMYELLSELTRNAGNETRTQTIKEALKFYDWRVKEIASGREIVSRTRRDQFVTYDSRKSG